MDETTLSGAPVRFIFLFALAAVLFAYGMMVKDPALYASSVTLFNRPVATTTATSTYDYEVLYTQNGFVPSLLQVPIGSRVAFKNNSDTPLFVGSDPYPTHTDYPDFNSGKEYAPGQTYIFTFTKGGTFGYDNDAHVSNHAFIQVTDPTHPLPFIDETPPNQRAERDKLLTLFRPGDPSSIFTVFSAIQADPTFAVNCHEAGHALGHEAYELYGFSGAMASGNANYAGSSSVENICAGGYMHGVLEEVFIHQPELKNNPGLMCAGVPQDDQATCFHGVGHALMFVNKRNVEESLSGCRSLPNASDASRCFEGVWMELFWGSTEHSGVDTLGWNTDKPLDPCIGTEPDAKPACYIYAPFGYFVSHPQNYSGAVQLCTTSGLEGSDAGFCLKGVGITMISHFGGTHLEQSEQYVADLSYANKYAFYQGVLGYALLSGIGRNELAGACAMLSTDTGVCIAALASE